MLSLRRLTGPQSSTETETPEDARFTSYDAAEWIKDVGPVEWLVDGLFPKQSKILVSAGSKVGKSWLITALMKASIEDDYFLGCRVPDITPDLVFH